MKIILFANTDWYLFNFRLSLARALQGRGHEVLLIRRPASLAARLIPQSSSDVAAFARAGLARPELVRLVMGSWRYTASYCQGFRNPLMFFASKLLSFATLPL